MGINSADDVTAVGTAEHRARSIGEMAYGFLDRHSHLVLAFICLVFFALIVQINHRKPLWYDEIFTVLVATQPDWNHFVGAMPPEGNPPLNAVLVRFFVSLFGANLFSFRLPALLGFTGTLVGIYVYIRRELGGIYGLLAVALILGESVWLYAFEARPYGLMLGFLTLALTGWQAAARAGDVSRPRVLALTVMAIGILGCIFSHNIGVVEVGVPLLFGEVTRSWQRRRLDWPMITTSLIAIPGILGVLPGMRRTGETILSRVDIIGPPITLHKLLTYTQRISATAYLVIDREFLEVSLLLIFLSLPPAVFFFRKRTVRQTDAPILSDHLYVVAAAIGSLLLIPVTWLFMIKTGGWYFCRYGIGAVIGLSVLSCFLLNKSKAKPVIVTAQIGIAAIFFVFAYHQYLPEHPIDSNAMKFMAFDRTGLPLVIVDPFEYPVLLWYAPKNSKQRLFYLKTSTTKQGLTGGVSEESLLAEAPYMGASISEVDTFLRSTDHFWLDCVRTQHPLLEKIKASGFQITAVNGVQNIYEVRRSATVAAGPGI